MNSFSVIPDHVALPVDAGKLRYMVELMKALDFEVVKRHQSVISGQEICTMQSVHAPCYMVQFVQFSPVDYEGSQMATVGVVHYALRVSDVEEVKAIFVEQMERFGQDAPKFEVDENRGVFCKLEIAPWKFQLIEDRR